MTNGRQLAEIARQSRPDLRVLFVTGDAEAATVRGGFLAAGMDMLTKPFALDTLGSKVREMIERKPLIKDYFSPDARARRPENFVSQAVRNHSQEKHND